MSENEQQEKKVTYEELKGNSFKQNTFWTWRPKQSAYKSAVTFIIFGLGFIAMGFILLYESNEVKDISITYSDSNSCLPSVSTMIFETLSPPIFIYYEIEDLHQNYRRFSASKSTDQLNGDYSNNTEKVESCFPVITEADRLGNTKA